MPDQSRIYQGKVDVNPSDVAALIDTDGPWQWGWTCEQCHEICDPIFDRKIAESLLKHHRRKRYHKAATNPNGFGF